MKTLEPTSVRTRPLVVARPRPDQSAPDRQPARRRGLKIDRWIAGALAVTALAFALRVTGLGYGLPFHYQWDEPTIMNRVIRMGSGDLNPHFFVYGTLLMYIFLVAQGFLYVVGKAMHVYASTDSFLISYLTDSTASYMVGRALVAMAGTATVFVTYLVGRRFISPGAGLLGALILAVSPVHVSNSHFATSDVPMAFFATLSLVFIWQVYKRGLLRDYLLAGLVVGLGVSTKYLPVALLVSVGLAHVFRLWRAGGRWTFRTVTVGPIVAGGVAFAAFALTSPYVLLDWSTALHNYRMTAQIDGATGCTTCQLNFVPYLTQTLGWAVGWPAYILALGGLLSVPLQHGEQRLRFILLASWPVILFLMIGSEQQPWPRWLAPIAPFASIAAAAVLLSASRRIAQYLPRVLASGRNRSAWPRAIGASVAAVAAVVILIPPALSSIRYDASLLQQDSRTATVIWFHDQVPSGTKVAIQPLLDRYFFTAQLPTESQLAIEEGWIPPTKVEARSLLEATYRSGPTYEDVPFTYDYDQLKAAGVRYVVLSSAHYHFIDPALEDKFYAQLSSRARLVKRFAPASFLPDAEYFAVSAPVITVYELT